MAVLQAFKIRVDDPDDVFGDKLKVFIGKFNSHLLVQETQPKIHYHMYLLTDVTHDALRARLKVSIPSLEGNKSYSMSNKHSDWPGYIGYCLKYENTKVISHQGLDLPLDTYREYYADRVREAEQQRTNQRNQDRHCPVWDTVAKYLSEHVNILPTDELSLLQLKEWCESDGADPPPYFRRYVENCYNLTMAFLTETGRELHNYKIQGYVENYLNKKNPYYRSRTCRRLALRTLG